jgi:hypothetical protein
MGMSGQQHSDNNLIHTGSAQPLIYVKVKLNLTGLWISDVPYKKPH